MKAILYLLPILLLLTGCSGTFDDDIRCENNPTSPYCKMLNGEGCPKDISSIKDDICMGHFGILNNDPTACEKITDDTNKNSCYEKLAKTLTDYPACEKITTQQYKDQCLNRLIHERKDPASCDKYFPNDKTCIAKFAENIHYTDFITATTNAERLKGRLDWNTETPTEQDQEEYEKAQKNQDIIYKHLNKQSRLEYMTYKIQEITQELIKENGDTTNINEQMKKALDDFNNNPDKEKLTELTHEELAQELKKLAKTSINLETCKEPSCTDPSKKCQTGYTYVEDSQSCIKSGPNKLLPSEKGTYKLKNIRGDVIVRKADGTLFKITSDSELSETDTTLSTLSEGIAEITFPDGKTYTVPPNTLLYLDPTKNTLEGAVAAAPGIR